MLYLTFEREHRRVLNSDMSEMSHFICLVLFLVKVVYFGGDPRKILVGSGEVRQGKEVNKGC